MAYEITKASKDDIDKLYEINNIAHEWDKWTREKFEQVFEFDLSVLVAKHNEDIVGFVIYLVCLDEVRIINISVHPANRNQGHAKRLIYSVCQNAKDSNWRYVLLDVRVSNFALNLYKKMGFRILTTRKEFYDTFVEDAYFMQLDIRDFDFNQYDNLCKSIPK